MIEDDLVIDFKKDVCSCCGEPIHQAIGHLIMTGRFVPASALTSEEKKALKKSYESSRKKARKRFKKARKINR